MWVHYLMEIGGGRGFIWVRNYYFSEMTSSESLMMIPGTYAEMHRDYD